ncbi:Fatty acid desaturase-like protein 1 [Elsinoe fawcettii]|nr:Fatty acid desaturase-like protein 1 [Elsinoe fawcettii]
MTCSEKSKRTSDEVLESPNNLNELRQAIPTHCFESSLKTSFAYLTRDILYAATLVWLALRIDDLPHWWLRAASWTVYGFTQGLVGTGIWILAHECGHGGFSRYPGLNNIIGWACHSALLVPYYSWKITHARHHRYTGHIDKDPAFSPVKESELPEHTHADHDMWEDAPIVSIFQFLTHQLFGWQLYLFFNVTAGTESGPASHSGKPTGSHFNPYSDLFEAHQRVRILISDLGLALTLGLLYYTTNYLPTSTVLLLYLLPYAWVHHWLVAITYLHHTNQSVPYYDNTTWTYRKGALSTIDRSLGWIGRHFMHDIIDHHVVHHLFPKIPFYHAQEATEAIKPLLGDEYRQRKDVGFLRDLVRTFGECVAVREDGKGRWLWVTAEK